MHVCIGFQRKNCMRAEIDTGHRTMRGELDVGHVTVRGELDLGTHFYLLECL